MAVSEILHQALTHLVSNQPVKQRVTLAFSMLLAHVEALDLPDNLHADYRELMETVQSVRPLTGETAIQATVRKMSPEQTQVIAANLVQLVLAFERQAHSHSSLRREPRDLSDTVIPLFAVEA